MANNVYVSDASLAKATAAADIEYAKLVFEAIRIGKLQGKGQPLIA